MSVMSQEGASRLQTSSNPWTFSINVTSPFRIHFPLPNPTDELYHYRVTCVILLSRIKFYLVLVLALV
jgi:hypothetical protein